MARMMLGEMLKREGLVGDLQLANALAHQRKWGCRIGESLLRLGLVGPQQLLAVAARQAGVPAVRIGERTVAPEALRRLPEGYLLSRRVLPLDFLFARRGLRLVVAFTTPDDLALVDEVAFVAGLPVDPVLVSDEDLDQALARHGIGATPPPVEPLELPPAPAEPMQLVGPLQLDA